jgi:hypothetical protein
MKTKDLNSNLKENELVSVIPVSNVGFVITDTKKKDSYTWSGELPAPVIVGTPTCVAIPGTENVNVTIEGSLFVLLDSKNAVPACTCQQAFVDAVSNYTITYNAPVPKIPEGDESIEITVAEVFFTITNTLMDTGSSLTVILIADDEDPITARGTMTTILKSST